MSAPQETIPESIGRYKLIRKIGQGGMGLVFEAEHQLLRKRVALKLLPRDLTSDQAAVARFEREIEAVGRIDHPAIVRALDADRIDGQLYLAMELVDGFDIEAIAKSYEENSDRCLPVADCCELVRQAAIAVHAAHAAGLIHRDIKPSNLLLDSAGNVKLLDLGLALLETGQSGGEQLTRTGDVMGTVDYMSPEQAIDTRSVDLRTDVYSLGATLYRLLGGRPPYPSNEYPSLSAKLLALTSTDPRSIRDVRRDCPTELSDIVSKAMARNRNTRTATAEELATELEPFAAQAALSELISWPIRNEAEEPTVVKQRDSIGISTTEVASHDRFQRNARDFGPQSESPSPTMSSMKAPLLIASAIVVVLLIVFIPALWNADREQTSESGKSIEDREIGRQNDVAETGTNAGEQFGDNTIDDSNAGNGKQASKAASDSSSAAATVEANVNQPPRYVTLADTGGSSPAIYLDGVDDLISLPFGDPGGDITIEMQVTFPLTPTAFRTVFGNSSDPRNREGTGLEISTGSYNDLLSPVDFSILQARHYGKIVGRNSQRGRDDGKGLSTWLVVKGPPGTMHGQRHRLAFVRQSDQIRLFVDGERVGLQATDSVAASVHHALRTSELPFWIGAGRDHQYVRFGEQGPTGFTTMIVDNIRISSSAREPSEFIGATTNDLDDQTLALYYCNGNGSQLIDSSPNGYDAQLTGCQRVVGGPQGVVANSSHTRRALRFDAGREYARVTNIDIDLAKPFTVETWVTTTPIQRSANSIGFVGDVQNAQTAIRFGPVEVRLEVTERDVFWTGRIMSCRNPSAGVIRRNHRVPESRCHLAFVWDGKEFQLAVDGEFATSEITSWSDGVADLIYDECLCPQSADLVLGTGNVSNPFDDRLCLFGCIDAVRISPSCRYPLESSFEPPELFDEATESILLFDVERQVASNTDPRTTISGERGLRGLFGSAA